ncbi:HypC/HybG/HupF family hydrogenase formation chaperone [Pontibacterium granulatum]|uniref:HypC/HybG/HupF family hydrogenase formation chaperone n=1 Tax=Pontibacterium granulatum TaxID=2036029 RepID=UPI00249C88EA|nr:HypC/HybG/HupF family hydrogenase formation chaperone [Pontibacterium granulatum]MDI3323295.1 HypC/HybG/HupF family hydrogenase formation chaperone [Pontibacterium granulatum]
MCLGIPMQVIRSEEGSALCSNGSEQQWVDLSLVGEQARDTWVLVFLDAAREVLDESRALQIRDALSAVQAVMAGREANLDDLFADLVDREPQLPPHLQNN